MQEVESYYIYQIKVEQREKMNNDEMDRNRSKARATAQSSLGWVGKGLVSCYNISL